MADEREYALSIGDLVEIQRGVVYKGRQGIIRGFEDNIVRGGRVFLVEVELAHSTTLVARHDDALILIERHNMPVISAQSLMEVLE